MNKFRILARIFHPHIRPHNGLVLVFFVLLISSLLTGWSAERESIFFLGTIDLYNVTLSNIREEAFKVLFYDLYSTFWLILLLTHIPNQIIFPLSQSFSVNQNLWVRLLPNTTVFDAALAKVYTLLISCLLICLVSGIWASVYAGLKNVPLADLLVPVVGMSGQVFFATGLVFLVCSNRKLSVSSRKGSVYLLLLLPIMLYWVGDAPARKLNGFFPFSAPYAAKYNGHIVLKPFLLTLLFGLLFVSYFLLSHFLQKIKNQTI